MKVNLIVGELPPRARRIQLPKIQRFAHVGTTSACAENTLESFSDKIMHWNYLRVRGEYTTMGFERLGTQELPPRARRIPQSFDLVVSAPGTTSACAENTPQTPGTRDVPRNYLRVRGEYSFSQLMPAATAELPPRARRILARELVNLTAKGTTSACAENTA